MDATSRGKCILCPVGNAGRGGGGTLPNHADDEEQGNEIFSRKLNKRQDELRARMPPLAPCTPLLNLAVSVYVGLWLAA